jgi:NADH dehydrogenase [ubiquinone] 1 alpha subcomplex assembly factor 7
MQTPPAIPFHSFMQEALYGPAGYYTHGRNFTTTPPRDFITAPELTPLFGATLANWVAAKWQQLGAPEHFILAELGPGRGSLMHGLLTHLHAQHPVCYAALQAVLLVEVSPFLAQLQQATLKQFTRCTWAESLPTFPSEPPLVVVGNEVLDALPAQPYRLTAQGWEELWVEDTTLNWQPCAPPPLPQGWQPAVGAAFEVIPSLPALLNSVRAVASSALFIDYGSPTLPPNAQSTVQAVQRHQPVPLLHAPGESDLTVHINFAEVAQLLGPTACTLSPLADFLLQHGLPNLALPYLPHPATESALHRLLHPAQMGTLHQALCYTRSTL